MRHLNKTVIAAAALLFSAAHANANATSVPSKIRVECHETRVDTVTTTTSFPAMIRPTMSLYMR